MLAFETSLPLLRLFPGGFLKLFACGVDLLPELVLKGLLLRLQVAQTLLYQCQRLTSAFLTAFLKSSVMVFCLFSLDLQVLLPAFPGFGGGRVEALRQVAECSLRRSGPVLVQFPGIVA